MDDHDGKRSPLIGTGLRRLFGKGDTVTPRCPIKRVPIDTWDVPPLIPAGAEGRIVHVREYDSLPPYIVHFDGYEVISVYGCDITLAPGGAVRAAGMETKARG